MKKIIATFTVIAATALGAQGQTNTVTFANSGSTSLSDLTFSNVASTNLTPPYSAAKVQLRFTNLPTGGSINVSNITLTGQGITAPGGLTFPLLSISNINTWTSVEQTLDEVISSWSSSNNKVSFDIGISGSLPFDSQARYRIVYFSQIDTEQTLVAQGNLNLVAVPEPSTYLMTAAGLLGLFLWSARRRLFKLAGARCAAASGNGAA
jgi:hypothetical protein